MSDAYTYIATSREGLCRVELGARKNPLAREKYYYSYRVHVLKGICYGSDPVVSLQLTNFQTLEA